MLPFDNESKHCTGKEWGGIRSAADTKCHHKHLPAEKHELSIETAKHSAGLRQATQPPDTNESPMNLVTCLMLDTVKKILLDPRW